MFATLTGSYPAAGPGTPRERLRRLLDDQLEAGLELLSDGSIDRSDPIADVAAALTPRGAGLPRRAGPLTVESWRTTQELAGGVSVKQCLAGPYTLGRRLAPDEAARDRVTEAVADALAEELADLAAAGCSFVQVDEPDAIAIGADPLERRRFADAHTRLLAGRSADGGGPHLSLAIVGGNADAAGPETIFAAPYDSHLFDLIDGPDNWRLIVRAPLERGIVLGALDPRPGSDDDLSILVWAVGYAASGGRGEARIGLAPSGGMAGLPAEAARAKLAVLGAVAKLVERRAVEPIAAALDSRAIDIRSAALGWRGPRRPGPRR